VSDTSALNDWIDSFAPPGASLFAKRLAGDDTWANGSFEDAFFVPARIFLRLFPLAAVSASSREPTRMTVEFSSHQQGHDGQFVSECQSVRRPRRAEMDVMIAGIGGASSPLLDPENTGGLAVIVARPQIKPAELSCSVWVCGNAAEEDIVERWLGPVDPGTSIIWTAQGFEMLAA